MKEEGRTAGTLELVAELAGVSRSTVSRALNDDPHVRASTRAKILEIVERKFKVIFVTEEVFHKYKKLIR